MNNPKISRYNKNRRLALLGLAGLAVALVALAIFLGLGGNSEASAKEKDRGDSKDLVKTLKIVSVDSPASFNGVGRYPTRRVAGQKLLAVTIDFDRDFKSHLRASEAGEVYLTGSNPGQTYFTVDTAYPLSDGPGKKPVTQATFVFSVPEGAKQLTFHYGALYSAPL